MEAYDFAGLSVAEWRKLQITTKLCFVQFSPAVWQLWGVKPRAEAFLHRDRVPRSWLGCSMQSVTPQGQAGRDTVQQETGFCVAVGTIKGLKVLGGLWQLFFSDEVTICERVEEKQHGL